MSARQVFFSKPRKYYTIKFIYLITQMLKDTAHYTISTTVYLYSDFVFRLLIYIANLIYLNKAVFLL